MAVKTYIVKHRKQYLSVGGKLQHIPFGTEVEIDEKAAANLVATGKLEEATVKKTAKVDSKTK